MLSLFKHAAVIVVTVLLLSAATAVAQEPARPDYGSASGVDAYPSGQWQAAYWDNINLAGTPVVSRYESTLDYDWGNGSPAAPIDSDSFSARWTRQIETSAGTYRFAATSDDGVRVWVDGQLIIDAWSTHPAQTYTQEVDLAAGTHRIRVDYFEDWGQASLNVSWDRVPGELWQAEFFDNRNLDGGPAYSAQYEDINFNWNGGSPADGVPANNFSARWTRTINFAPGTYHFTVTSDDGARLSIGNRQIIDAWSIHPAETHSATVDLAGGRQAVHLEYFEATGDALVRLEWERVSSPTWFAQFYDNRSLQGNPVYLTEYSSLNFDWGNGSPSRAVNADNFSAEFTHMQNFQAGTYRFAMTVDDGGRLWVNGQLLIDAWKDQEPTQRSATVRLDGGEIPIRMTYYEHQGQAVARLSWSRTQQPGARTGTVVVDDEGQGFTRGGDPADWHSEAAGYNNHLQWSLSANRVHPNYNWGRWRPDLQPGDYEVFVYIPDQFSTTSNARYWIHHGNNYTLRTVDQSANGGQWVSLDTYAFRGTGQEHVSLADVTFEAGNSRIVAWDAVRWERR